MSLPFDTFKFYLSGSYLSSQRYQTSFIAFLVTFQMTKFLCPPPPFFLAFLFIISANNVNFITSSLILFLCSCRYFAYFFDLVIFANAFFIAMERNDVEVLFLVIFNIEIALKFYTYGLREFFQRFWNV